MLSIIIITKNEAFHIQRCLESVAWADEIIVFDSGSDDETVAICQQFTQHVFVTDWPGFGLQKQRALDKATQQWVLSIDADEVITPELKDEILNALSEQTTAGYLIPRLSNYCGREIKHSGWWPDYVLRLFRRDQGHFSAELVHEQVLVTGKLAHLTNPILHDAFLNPEEVLHKLNNYSSLGAEKLFQQHKSASLGLAIVKGFWAFIRTYFIKAGFLDGPEGLMLAISNAEGTYYKYLKLRQLVKSNSQHD